ncbi:LOW QUALITY PROTEIN: xin actin-binding repeat-containing protein 2-like [Salmo salar]|uniref:LOW QUALITY PROTEIN: xin actin-binding repeat-containing protein 2-like n=1 Tax=Salmo salar TaxID=8030 RepID=A0A1S3MVL8_SALSA|nr:LOW QUALITY PROTEIN: xin actin-binding repeat-containing protein 2-like [Salmo salar]
MEIQSGNGVELEVVSGESLATSGSVSSSPYLSGPQADGTDDQVLREDLQAAKTIERFDIPLSNLKRMFEKPPGAANTEVRAVQSSPSRRAPASSYQLDQKRDPSPGEKMASTHDPSLSAGGTRPGRPEEREGVVSQRKGDGGAPTSEEAESVSLKERMAMYQAAVSKKEASSSSATVMEESEACSLPGGLASVKKQFESQEYASSSQSQTSITQVHLEKRSVQEVSSSQEVTVRSSVREVIPTTQQVAYFHGQEVTHDQRVQQSNVASSYENHYDETVRVIGGEDLPKVSTQALKQQYEKTIEQATPGKQIKIDLDYNQFQWAPINQSSSAAASYESSSIVKQSSRASAATSYETSSTMRTGAVSSSTAASASSTMRTGAVSSSTAASASSTMRTGAASSSTAASASSTMRTGAVSSSTAASASSMDYETMEHFPPPPTELMPQEVPECCDSLPPQDQGGQQRYIFNKEQYSKQRNLNELKRLYKHIHPEVRRTMEKDYFTDVTEIEQAQLDSEDEMTGEVQQACYAFENSGGDECMSPEGDYLEWDEILKGEVQSMRWMFENKPLDTIKDDTPDEDDEVKNIAQQEIIAGSDVKYTAWMFETQPMDALRADTPDSTVQTGQLTELARGDVRTATYLFETQPLDCLNKIYQEDEQALEVVFTKDITGGDVKTARYLFETQHLDSLSHTETIEESHFLKLKSELEEIKGEVKTTTRMFETQPMCVIRGNSGNILEITAIRREEMEKGDVKTSRWLFETQPLDMINKDPAKVKLICGVSMEDNSQGDVNRGRWLFETKTLDSIKDEEWQSIRQKEEIIGADVRKHCLVFETQQMDTLKDNANARHLPSEAIVGGDVRSAKHLFETVPMENLKDLAEVGKLQKMVASEEEKGDVRHQKWVFESQPLENIREEKKEMTRSINLEELDKGDVTNHKERFETLDLSRCEGAQRIQVEGVTSGSVKSNKVLFESTPMYAMQDSEGHYHEVKTVRREEIVKGDVRSCRWMFETRPIDEFDESSNKFQIIKGISKEEIESGDVKTAKWLFETQPLDGIKHFSNTEEDETKTKESVEIEKGDVKTCRWLFETQPMDNLYEKADKVRNETEVEEVNKGDVKTCTWLFETQNLDNICDHSESESETVLKTCTVKQEDVQGKDVHHARFLFETENLENLTGEESGAFRRVTKIDVQSGDVSRMKFLFQNRSSDIMTSTSSETMQKLKTLTAEEIQKGNVVNNMWLFENQPIDTIREDTEEAKDTRTVTDVQGGNVGQGRFIFETYSLDKIQEESTETEISKLQSIIRDDIEKGDVKSYTMMFENQPLYAICDKEGHYHEVTTMTKEEIMRGDVVGARWLFETKPLDSIRDTDDVYVIKSVTEEDVQKGDVSTARWRFETQPLDEIAEDMKVLTKTVEDIQGGDVKTNKHLFETDEMSQKYVRTVSVSEIQKGDVRTASWMFETHSIDKIHGEGSEYDEMETVTKEEVMKGDVKQSVWLFEKQPLDSIKESDGTETVVTREEIPQADVKSTTWLFETTPLTKFNENSVERTEIMGKSIKETLEELYCQKMVDSQGILIETDEIGDVRMAKYRLMNQDAPEIQKEEVIRGDLNNIMMNLLNRREMTEKGIVIDQEERGNINTTVKQLFNQEKGFNVEKEEILRGDIQEAINNLLKEEGSSKRGILIQEDEKGDVRMTIYSLLNKEDGAGIEKEDIIKGNVSRTLHRLLSNPGSEESKRIRVEDTERGNVSFYSTCIESGALDYLRQLQFEPNEEQEQAQKERIIGGDIMETKMTLWKNQQQIERTVADDDIVPGDVNNTVKVFMMEPALLLENLQKEEIVKGDLRAALDSLTKTISKRVVIEKEEVVKGDLHTTLRSLEDAQNQAKEMEKPEIVRGDIRGALQSLEKSATTKTEVTVEDLVPGDIKGTLKSLEEAKQAVKEMEKEEIVKGDIHTALKGLHEASSEKKLYQHQVSEQGDVRGTIQLLLEPSTSPRMQRRGSTEGDVKTSIKCLYEGQGQDQDEEQSQMEKEEVIKGDVKGAIKNLMQRKEYSNRKVRKYPPRKAPRAHVKNPLPTQQVVDHEYSDVAKNENVTVNLAPAVKNLSQSQSSKLQDTTQKHTEMYTENKSVKSSKTLTQEEHSMTTQVQTVNIMEASQQEHGKEQTQVKEQTHVKQQSVKLKLQPPPKHMIIKKKNLTNQMTDNTSMNQMTEIKAANQMTLNQSANQMTLNQSANQMTVNKSANQMTVNKSVNHMTENKAANQMIVNKSANHMSENKASNQMTVNKSANHMTENKAANQMIVNKSANHMTENKASNQMSVNKSANHMTENKAVSDINVTKETQRETQVSDMNVTTQVKTVNMSESSQQTQVEEQAVKQKTPPAPKPIFINKKNMTNQMTDNTSTNQMKEIKAANQMTENKAAADLNVMKETQSTSQTIIVSKQTQETKTMKQLQTTVTEHKTVTQKHNVKNLNTNFRNLDMKGKGMLKKGTPEIHFPPPPTSSPPPSESEMSLPPPPSPVAGCPMSLSSRSPMFPTSRPLIMRQDSDLPPPPPPPPVECGEPDFFPSPPPPPPPSVAGQDFLPPPPSQQELNSMPHQVPTPPPGKPFKARPLFKIPKPEPPKQPILVKPKWQKKQVAPPPPPPPPQPMTVQAEHKEEGVVQEVKREISCKQEENTNTTNTQVQSDSTVSMTKIPSPIPVAKPPQEELPRPPKKVFVPPIKIPPPTEPAPVAKPKPYARKFKTPLMLAEERYRVQREEAERNKSQDTTPASSRVTSPTSPPTNMMQMMGSTNVASEQHSDAHKTEQSKVTSEVTHEQAEETHSKSKVRTASQEPPTKKALSHIPLSKPLISMVNKESNSESGNISSDKKHITIDQSSMVSSGKELASSVASRKHQAVSSGKHQSVFSGKHQAVSVSAAHSHHESNIKVQSGSNVISSSVAEQQSGMTAISQSIISTQSIVQENVNLQTQSAITSEAENAKNTNAFLTQEVKNIPSQPTKIKIPKVTPNFKVRTVKLPTEKMEEKSEVVEKDQRAVKNELHVHQTGMETISKSETRVVQESTQMATSSSAKNEVKVEMNVTQEKAEEVEKTAAAKETKLQIQMKTKAKQKGIKIPLPKEPKLVPMPVAQAPGHCHISVSHSQQSMQEQHIQKHEQVIVNARVVQQSFQKQEQQVRTPKQQVKSFQQQGEVSKMQQHQERSKAESKAVSMNIAGNETAQSMVESTAQSVEETTDSEKCVMVQKLLFNIKQLHPGKMDSNSVRTILSEVPDWLMRAEEKRDLTQVAVQQNKKKLTEIIFRVRNLAQAKLVFLEGHMAAMAKQESEPAPASSPAPPPAPHHAPPPASSPASSPAPPPAPHPAPPPASSPAKAHEKKGFGGATAKISKISIGSSRVETYKKVVEEKKISHESKKPELTEVKGPDPRVPSPMLATRTPSPTFISIESVRRTNSPLIVTPSPPPSYRSGATPTPPPPPPRTPTSRFCRATPSPTLSRSEKLAKLKDSTAKLSRGMTPPPPMPEFLMTEQASDREDSPALIEPEIHMQTQEMETGTTTPDVADMVDSMMTVRDKKFFFEEAQKAEVSRTYMRKDPIEIPERLGPDDIEEVPEVVNIDIMKEDLPRLDLSKLVNQFESPQPKLYIRKDPIIITDRLGSDTEDPEADPKTPKTDETPAFNIKAIKNAFDLGDRNALKEVREKQEERERRESESAEPTGHSKTKSVTEEFSGMDEFGTVTRGVRSETSMHSESHMTRPLPPSYADVVKGTVEEMAVPVEAATEDLLKSFHQSWAESESVFQNLGFSVSEQRTSQIVTHQQETVVTENSSSRVRTVYGVSEEGVSDGVSDRRQTQFP